MDETGTEGFRLAAATPVRRSAAETVHATCVVIDEGGVLIRGAPAAGKSTLARELVAIALLQGRFARLVSDDRTESWPVEQPAWVRDLPIAEPWHTYAGSYAPQARAFLDALAEGRTPDPSLDEAVAAHRLADAVYRSAASGGAPLAP